MLGLAFEDLQVGMSDSVMRTITSQDVVGFATLSGDNNPIHLSDHFAAQSPFGERIAHGLYVASLISAVLGTRLPGPGAIYLSQTLRFRAPVKIGDVVTARVEVSAVDPERRRATLACSCIVDTTTVIDGEAVVMVPSRSRMTLDAAERAARRA